MPRTHWSSSALAPMSRPTVATPMYRSASSNTNATGRTAEDSPWEPMRKPMTISDADRNDRNIPARLKASLYASERVANRLQCSVLRIWSARGSASGPSPGVAGPGRAAIGGASVGIDGVASCIGLPP